MSMILSLANAILGLTAAVLQFWFMVRCLPSGKRVYHALIGLLAAYWGIVYTWILLGATGSPEFCQWFGGTNGDCGMAWVGLVFVRPAITLTLTGLLILSLRRWKGL